MGGIVKLKNFFRNKDKPQSYKREHFLNRLPQHKIEEILLFSEGDNLGALWPSFERRKILFLNDQKHKYVFNKILSAEPAYLVNYVYAGPEVNEQKSGYSTVMGDLENLSLRKNHFDLAICPMALEDFGTIETFVKKTASILDNGSRLVISIRHPQLDNILFNQNPASTQVTEGQVSRYFALFKEAGLYTEDLREGVVDLALKPFFTDSEHDYYHEYKNTPISLLFRTVKFVRKTSQT